MLRSDKHLRLEKKECMEKPLKLTTTNFERSMHN